MSSPFQQHIKCRQCSPPGQPHASTTSPLSPTLTLLSVYLRAGPVFSVKGRFNVSCSHIPELCCVSFLISLCAFTVPALKMSLSASRLLLLLLRWHHRCTLSPGSLFVPCICPVLNYLSFKTKCSHE